MCRPRTQHTQKHHVARRKELEAWLLLHARRVETRGSQATTLEVRGGQATRRGASCYTYIAQNTRKPIAVHFFCVDSHRPAWFWLRLGGIQCCVYLPDPATLNAQRTRHGATEPAGTCTCAMVYTRGPPEPRSRESEKRPTAGREKLCMAQKKGISYMHVSYIQEKDFRPADPQARTSFVYDIVVEQVPSPASKSRRQCLAAFMQFIWLSTTAVLT